MKPTVVDPGKMIWVNAGVYSIVGIFLAIFDHPLVPLSYAFQILPLAIGGAVAAAVLQEKYGRWWIAAFAVLEIWLFVTCGMTQTTFAPVLLAAGIFYLTRGCIRWVAQNGG